MIPPGRFPDRLVLLILCVLLTSCGLDKSALSSICNSDGHFKEGEIVSTDGLYFDFVHESGTIGEDKLGAITLEGYQYLEYKVPEHARSMLPKGVRSAKVIRLSLEDAGHPSCSGIEIEIENYFTRLHDYRGPIIPDELCLAARPLEQPQARYEIRTTESRAKGLYGQLGIINYVQGLYDRQTGEALRELNSYRSDRGSGKFSSSKSCTTIKSPFTQGISDYHRLIERGVRSVRTAQRGDNRSIYYSLFLYNQAKIAPEYSYLAPSATSTLAARVHQSTENIQQTREDFLALHRNPAESLLGKVFSLPCRNARTSDPQYCLVIRDTKATRYVPLPLDYATDEDVRGVQWVIETPANYLAIVGPLARPDREVNLRVMRYSKAGRLEEIYTVPLHNVAWQGAMVKLIESASLKDRTLSVILLEFGREGTLAELGSDVQLHGRVEVEVELTRLEI